MNNEENKMDNFEGMSVAELCDMAKEKMEKNFIASYCKLLIRWLEPKSNED